MRLSLLCFLPHFFFQCFLNPFLFLLPFISFADQFVLPLSKQFEEVEDGEDQGQEIYEKVADGVHLGSKVANPGLHHDEGPGKSERHQNVDDLPKNHVPRLLIDQLPQLICLFQPGGEPLQEKYKGKIGSQKKKDSSTTR